MTAGCETAVDGTGTTGVWSGKGSAITSLESVVAFGGSKKETWSGGKKRGAGCTSSGVAIPKAGFNRERFMDWATPSIKTCATLSLIDKSWKGPVYLGLSEESEIVLIQT